MKPCQKVKSKNLFAGELSKDNDKIDMICSDAIR
jgi:hypothetical protein